MKFLHPEIESRSNELAERYFYVYDDLMQKRNRTSSSPVISDRMAFKGVVYDLLVELLGNEREV